MGGEYSTHTITITNHGCISCSLMQTCLFSFCFSLSISCLGLFLKCILLHQHLAISTTIHLLLLLSDSQSCVLYGFSALFNLSCSVFCLHLSLPLSQWVLSVCCQVSPLFSFFRVKQKSVENVTEKKNNTFFTFTSHSFNSQGIMQYFLNSNSF